MSFYHPSSKQDYICGSRTRSLCKTNSLSAIIRVLTMVGREPSHLCQKAYREPSEWTDINHINSKRHRLWDHRPKQDIQNRSMEYQDLHRPPSQPFRFSPLPSHPLTLSLRPHPRTRAHFTAWKDRRPTPICAHADRVLILRAILPRAPHQSARALALQLNEPGLSVLQNDHVGSAQSPPLRLAPQAGSHPYAPPGHDAAHARPHP